jgi:flagellar protein FliS
MSPTAYGPAGPRAASAARSRFAAQSLETLSPNQLLVKLFERLQLDIARAETHQRAGEHVAASAQLVHAQAIVSELMTSLDVDRWSGAPRLMSIYTFLFSELIASNLQRDPVRTASCGRLVEPLVDAWRQAAAGGVTPVVPARRSDDVPLARTSVVG